jgi:hypothetical protein
MRELEFVVDRDARIVRVTGSSTMARFRGHSLWTYLPEAEPLLGPYFDEAAVTGDPVESTIFYAGGTVEVLVTPRRQYFAVRLRRRTELDVRTLATLTESLRSIEAELAARERVRSDRPALASRQALP